ncbi:MAG: HDOD domain-containing protein [Lentisphaeraceae bacterium]|nr:HDOD domain-containing protein [Lentisphaeraceae bacterium]
MHDLLIEELNKRLTEEDIELPLLPEIAQKVILMASNENINATQLSDIIHKDQALAGNILRITNSANYAGNVKIVSLQQAIARLGINLLREIALAASVQNSVFNVPGQEKIIKHLWQHSLATSAFAKEIARHRRRNVESAYLCGLLHNIGKPIALRTLQDSLKKSPEKLSFKAVLEILKETHQSTGIRMATEWDLPEQVAETIKFSDNFENCENFEDEVCTVTLAHMCADELLIPASTSVEEICNHQVIDSLNLYPEEIEAIIEKKEKIKELIQSMS